ncbi:MAG: efflux RND transporter periplasmic adaptor subunit [Acidobacteria bacterium]|nr:efflux RND transporter periplasmic adaptor subunit [Acidobacteriota bacterium]
MASKDKRPSQRLGKSNPRRMKIITWTVALLLCGGGVFAAYRIAGTTEVEVPVARARKGDFIVSVRTRGDIKSARSVVLKAPRVPGLRIVHLADPGRPVKQGDVVVEFDGSQQEQNVLSRTTNVRAVEGQITQMKASQRMDDEDDAMSKMSSEYDLERSKLDASKAEVLSAIEGEKNRIMVGVADGALQTVKASINAHQVGHEADLGRVGQSRDKAVRDLEQAKDYLGQMQIKAPIGGIVNILPNFRAQGSFGQSTPPFKEGDNVWTGAEICEIPDLSQMYVDLKLEEVDRGKLKLGQQVKIRVDAIPDKEFVAELDWISPIAALVFKGGATPEKTFPARATLKNLDDRLRPGMSSTSEIIIQREPGVLLIPSRASFAKNGKPAVYLQTGKAFQTRQIEIGEQNDEDVIVTGGLKDGDVVALENPAEAIKKAKKKM